MRFSQPPPLSLYWDGMHCQMCFFLLCCFSVAIVVRAITNVYVCKCIESITLLHSVCVCVCIQARSCTHIHTERDMQHAAKVKLILNALSVLRLSHTHSPPCLSLSFVPHDFVRFCTCVHLLREFISRLYAMHAVQCSQRTDRMCSRAVQNCCRFALCVSSKSALNSHKKWHNFFLCFTCKIFYLCTMKREIWTLNTYKTQIHTQRQIKKMRD